MGPLCISFCSCCVVYLPNTHDQSQRTYGVVDRAYPQVEDITHVPGVNKLIFDERVIHHLLRPNTPRRISLPIHGDDHNAITPYAASAKPHLHHPSHTYTRENEKCLNRVKKCFFFVSFSPSLLHITTKELAGIENHHGGKQSSPKPKEINFLFPF